jgi:hypothetical protein
MSNGSAPDGSSPTGLHECSAGRPGPTVLFVVHFTGFEGQVNQMAVILS